jgi:hypothetical protein
MPDPLPPADFNPTLAYEHFLPGPLEGQRRVRVSCFGKTVGEAVFSSFRPGRTVSSVVMRWAVMIISREYRKWLAQQKGGSARPEALPPNP